MIKVGQFMSSRLDVLPPEITAELEGLQDEVPPVPFPAIRALAEAELGVSLDRAFAGVDDEPIAAASLGQAHRARLFPIDAAETGLAGVVLKVQRPGIDAIVDVDLAALRKVGGWLSHVRLVSDRVDMPALVEEFAVTSLEEIDYLHEAANSERFAADFADDERVAVPSVVWERTTRRVLTLEDVTAIKITDVDGSARGRHRPGRGGAGLRGGHVRPDVHQRLLPRRSAPGQHLRHPHPERGERARLETHVHRLRHDGRGHHQHPQRASQTADRRGIPRRQGAGEWHARRGCAAWPRPTPSNSNAP